MPINLKAPLKFFSPPRDFRVKFEISAAREFMTKKGVKKVRKACVAPFRKKKSAAILSREESK
jgi:hypothetical protein